MFEIHLVQKGLFEKDMLHRENCLIMYKEHSTTQLIFYLKKL